MLTLGGPGNPSAVAEVKARSEGLSNAVSFAAGARLGQCPTGGLQLNAFKWVFTDAWKGLLGSATEG